MEIVLKLDLIGTDYNKNKGGNIIEPYVTETNHRNGTTILGLYQ